MDPPVLFLFIDRFSIYLGRQRGCPEAREGAQVMERWWENPGSPVPPTFQLAIHLLMHLTVGVFFCFLFSFFFLPSPLWKVLEPQSSW